MNLPTVRTTHLCTLFVSALPSLAALPQASSPGRRVRGSLIVGGGNDTQDIQGGQDPGGGRPCPRRRLCKRPEAREGLLRHPCCPNRRRCTVDGRGHHPNRRLCSDGEPDPGRVASRSDEPRVLDPPHCSDMPIRLVSRGTRCQPTIADLKDSQDAESPRPQLSQRRARDLA